MHATTEIAVAANANNQFLNAMLSRIVRQCPGPDLEERINDCATQQFDELPHAAEYKLIPL